ncbi:hypothetical protein LZ554_007458 [Drepanopeziza brunnea f. sp. 'monogermtubi']|nr:hypothetical protein LZ554_007458 [Drepanopeziza brunnea f. sp. 'monogermtubi']
MQPKSCTTNNCRTASYETLQKLKIANATMMSMPKFVPTPASSMKKLPWSCLHIVKYNDRRGDKAMSTGCPSTYTPRYVQVSWIQVQHRKAHACDGQVDSGTEGMGLARLQDPRIPKILDDSVTANTGGELVKVYAYEKDPSAWTLKMPVSDTIQIAGTRYILGLLARPQRLPEHRIRAIQSI